MNKLNKTLRFLVVPGLLAALSNVALAQVFEESHHEEDVVCDRENFANCLNGVSSSVTNGAGLRMDAARMKDIANERRRRQQAGGGTATVGLFGADQRLAAGDDMGGSVFGMWGSYSYNDFDSDFRFAGRSLGYDADAHNGLFGIDRLFNERLLLGLAVGYQSLEIDTVFNGGQQDSDGYTLAPYAALLLNANWSIDVSGGYTWLDNDQDRVSPADGSNISASFDSERWFIATNLNWMAVVQQWVLSAKVGYLHTDEDQDAYLESGNAASAALLRTVLKRNIDLSQVVAGGEIAYSAGLFEPFFRAEYRNDLSRDDGNRAGGLPGAFTALQPNDDDEVQLGVGLRYYTNWGVTTTLEYQRVEGRTSFDSDLFMFTLRAAL
ncbi:MAG: autotransporter outer membrane beta-barrel domain-containing protein [Gammaproteobacteria bacterium]|nr:autotransporter outer membrane beta-barrel domain-containing protein [Gammaproteobacteria bacterium]